MKEICFVNANVLIYLFENGRNMNLVKYLLLFICIYIMCFNFSCNFYYLNIYFILFELILLFKIIIKYLICLADMHLFHLICMIFIYPV